ncbi:MAG: DUF2752 domain-containing protein [Synergistaceae bacterium]|jgi:hypothetical protein|nr:DUF2752 domain-containing protein [Synergistaceae bacterium]
MIQDRWLPRGREGYFFVAFGACLFAVALFSLPTLCLWKLALGFPCPGCGLTRAFLLLARLRFAEAARMNILVTPLLLCGALALLCYAADRFFEGRQLEGLRSALTSKPAIAISALMALLSWGYNIAIGN